MIHRAAVGCKRPLGLEYRSDLPSKFGNSVANHIPHQLEGHAEVIVTQVVPHAGHGAPFHFGVADSEVVRHPPCRFADDLQDDRRDERSSGSTERALSELHVKDLHRFAPPATAPLRHPALPASLTSISMAKKVP